MQMDRLTTKSQEALQAAIGLGTRQGNPEILPEHVLVAILDQEDGVGRPLVELAGANADRLRTDLERELNKLPQVQGGVEPRFGRRTLPFYQAAEDIAKQLKDEFVSVEHFMLAAAKNKEKLARIFGDHGLTYDRLLAALQRVRGSQRVTDKDPEGKFQALDKYTRDLTALARCGKIDPVIGRDEEIRRVMQVLTRRT